MAAADILFQQALAAIHLQNRDRAQELLADLLEHYPRKPEYWLALSTVLDTDEERLYCIQQALLLDPDHAPAQKMLADLDRPPEPAWPAEPEVAPDPASPAPPLAGVTRLARRPEMRRRALLGGALLAVILLLAWALSSLFDPRPAPYPVQGISFEPHPSATASPTATPRPTATLRPGEPTPPWAVLAATYTPTPVFGLTPHPLTEAYSLARRDIQQGRWTEAIAFLEQVVTSEPAAVDALTQIGWLRLNLDQAGQALQAFEKALAMRADYAPAYHGRAVARLALEPDSLDAALQDLEQAVTLDPAFGAAHLERARLLLQIAQPALALDALAVAEAALPDSPLVPYYRGEAALLNGDAGEALRLAGFTLEMDLTWVPAYGLKARALQMGGDPLASLEPLEVFLRYTPEDQVEAGVHRLHALALIAHERLPEAVQAYARALALNPAETGWWHERAGLNMRLNDGPAAEEDYRAILELTPEDFTARMGLARALALQEDWQGAAQAYDRAEPYAQTEEDLALIFAGRAQCLRPIDPRASLLDWERLLQLPQDIVPPDLLVQALAEIAALSPTVVP